MSGEHSVRVIQKTLQSSQLLLFVVGMALGNDMEYSVA